MNFSDLNFSLPLVQWLVLAVIGVYSWVIGKQSASAREMLDLRMRITTIESQIRHMPTQKSLSDVMGHLSGMEANLSSVSKSIDSISRRIDNVNEYLLKNK